MQSWTKTAIVGFSLAWFLTPPLAHASCPGDCNPDFDVCCTDDCAWETDPSVRCLPFGETCRTKKCDLVTHQCNVGSFNALPPGTECFGSDPCLHGTCNGSAVCENQTSSPCNDGEDCTVDSQACVPTGPLGWECNYPIKDDGEPCVVSSPLTCKDYTCVSGVCSPTGDQPDGTECGALTNATTCAVKSCLVGECNGPQVGTPVSCVEQACRSRSCEYDAQTQTVNCVLTPKVNGTVCDTNPWDCIHQRCNSVGECKDRDTTTLKECDADAATGSHCKLSYCNGKKQCRTQAQYIHYIGLNNIGPLNAGVGFGRWSVEAASTTGRANRQYAIADPCPSSDGNPCTSDRCNGGGTDACHLYTGGAPGEPAASGCEAGWHCFGEPSCALLCSGTGTGASCACQ